MNPLERIIIDKINNEGPITFETFMDMALYYPELGYYSSPRAAIGKKGDFYTSPHLHPAFGAMVAKQLFEMWEFMGRPEEFQAVEMGAGAGYLCKDILDYLNTISHDIPGFINAIKYTIVEPYEYLKDKQKEILGNEEKKESAITISKSGHTLTWVESLSAFDGGIKGCVFSNELPDAFPVHIVEMDNELMEVYVNFDGNKICEGKKQLSTKGLTDYIRDFSMSMSSGYRTEINLKIHEWLHDVSASLKEGFLMTIDYGYSSREYYTEERSKGTLLCYHKHKFHDNPYQNIGEQDITAHVNFSSLMKWGNDVGLRTFGYCPQGTYLTASGIDEVITELYADSPDYLSEISKVKGLIFPQGMGASHQVMIQYKGEGDPKLRGFLMRNLVERL